MNTVHRLFTKYFIILFIGITVFWIIGAGLGATIPPWIVIAATVIFERIFLRGAVKERVARSFFIYIVFIIAATILASFIIGGGALFIIWFGIMGQACFFTCDSSVLLFPFAPIFILTGVIFIVLDLRAKDSIIRRHKTRTALIILGVIIFFLAGIFIVRPFIRRTISDMKTEQRMEDAEYYKREYLEIGEPTSEEQFIYARDNRILVSEMDGTNARIIKEIPLAENAKISSVSPGGTYYIATTKNQPWKWEGGYGPDGEYYIPRKNSPPVVTESSEVRVVSDNAFVMSVTSTKLLQDELKRCKWSFDEQFLACQYVGRASDREQLVLFNTADGATERVYDEPAWGGDTWNNFIWSDENLDLFYDQDGKIYHIDNIKEMSESGFTIPPHRLALPYSAPCFGAGAYQHNTIYCVATIKELPGYKTLPKNEFLTAKDGLILVYRVPEENESQNPIAVTKAPFSFGAGYGIALYPVNANYIAAYGTGNIFFLLNLQTGKINPFQTFTIRADDLVWTEYIETENIFYNAYKGTTGLNIFNNAYQGTVPVSYRGAQ